MSGWKKLFGEHPEHRLDVIPYLPCQRTMEPSGWKGEWCLRGVYPFSAKPLGRARGESHQQRHKAAHSLISVARATLEWNKDWGPISSSWSRQFAGRYISAVDNKRHTEFLEDITLQAQVGRKLVDELARIFTECTLPTSSTALRAFIELTIKLHLRLKQGILALEDRVRLVSSFVVN